jgi:hypothetical protein
MLLYLEICIKNLTIKTFVINDLQKTLKNSIKRFGRLGIKWEFCTPKRRERSCSEEKKLRVAKINFKNIFKNIWKLKIKLLILHSQTTGSG